MEMLVCLYNGVITAEGIGSQYEHIKGTFEEVEIENGFKLVGTLQNGDKVEAFLTTEEYFDGKEFRIK